MFAFVVFSVGDSVSWVSFPKIFLMCEHDPAGIISFLRDERQSSILTVACSVGDTYQHVEVCDEHELIVPPMSSWSFSLLKGRPSLLVFCC